MGEGKEASSKKRVAGTEISKDNPYPDDDGPEPEMGTFKRATEEVMANRRIVKVRRQQPQSSASNPFANISFAVPSKATEKTDDPVEHVQPLAENHTLGDKEDTNKNDLEETKSKAKKKNDDPVEHVQPVDENAIIGGKEDTNNKPSKDLEEKVTEIGDNTVNYQGHIDSKTVVMNNSCGELAPNTDKVDEGVVFHKGDDQKTIQECQKDGDKTTRNSEGKNGVETVKEVSEETKESEKDTKTAEKNQDNDHKDKAEPTACFSSFQQLSSNQNAFTGVAGTGFSSISFSFGSIQKDGPSFDFGAGSKLGQQKELSSFPAFGFGSTNNGSSSVQLFGSHASDTAQAGGSTPVMQGVVETGEENEKVVFNADAVLFEYSNGGWKERGKGEVRVNVSTSNEEKARLVMRARGNYRLILNSSIYPGMSLKDMDKRSIIFPCVNNSAEQKGDGLTTFALKFRESLIMEEFRSTVTKYIEKSSGSSAMLKTPENSPKASDD